MTPHEREAIAQQVAQSGREIPFTYPGIGQATLRHYPAGGPNCSCMYLQAREGRSYNGRSGYVRPRVLVHCAGCDPSIAGGKSASVLDAARATLASLPIIASAMQQQFCTHIYPSGQSPVPSEYVVWRRPWIIRVR